MTWNRETKWDRNRIRRWRRRYPTLMTALIILAAAATLIGGRFAFGAQGKTPAARDAPSADSGAANGKAAGTADSAAGAAYRQAEVSVKDGVQYVASSLSAGGYDPITVKQGIPVKWTLNAPAGSLNGCNSRILIPEYDMELQLKTGDNLIEFTPEEAGTFTFSCWMGMIRSTISVVGGDGSIPPAEDGGNPGDTPAGGCCGGGSFSEAFADGKIPTDKIQIAKIVDGVQQATVKVDSYGYSPAVIVLERGKKFVLRFDPAEINGCNSVVYFPEYGGGIDLTEDTATPELTAEEDFSFECSMGMLHGYVKVVDDLDNVDMDAVIRDVESFVPSGGSGGACCR